MSVNSASFRCDFISLFMIKPCIAKKSGFKVFCTFGSATKIRTIFIGIKQSLVEDLKKQLLQ